MASNTTPPLSCDTLCKNILTVLLRDGMKLDEQLNPVSGELVSSPHNTILCLALRTLIEAPPSSPKRVECLDRAILRYAGKVQVACAASKIPNPINDELFLLVLNKIETLRNKAIEGGPEIDRKGREAPTLTLVKLRENFQFVGQHPNTVLNELLEHRPGSLADAPNNRILEQTLAVLNAAPTDSLPPSSELQQLQMSIIVYLNKTELSYTAAHKTNPIKAELVEQILAKTRSLYDLAKLHSPEPAPSLENISPPTTKEEKCAALVNYISGMVTEWYLYRAFDYTASLINAELQYRELHVKHGFRLGRTKAGISALPPLSFFESPWPILLLASRYQKVMKATPRERAEYREIIFQIKKAQERYSEHKEILESLLVNAETAEHIEAALNMKIECGAMLDFIRQSSLRNLFGTAMKEILNREGEIKKKLGQLQKLIESPFSPSSPTTMEEFEIGVFFERELIDVDTQLRDLFSNIVLNFKNSIAQHSPYHSALLKAQKCGIIPTSRDATLLKFKPMIPRFLFSPGSPFFTFISPHLPSEEEFSQFPLCHFISEISSFSHEYEALRCKTTLTQEEKREFLPVQLRTKSTQCPLKTPKKKEHKHKKLKSKDPSHSLDSSLSQSLEQLSLETRETGCILAPTAENKEMELPTETPLEARKGQNEVKAQPYVENVPESKKAAPLPDIGFCVGERANLHHTFHPHVLRWWKHTMDSPLHPFNFDPTYREKNPPLSWAAKEAIAFRHTPPLPLIDLLLKKGKRFVHAENSDERFYLPADVTWHDGSGRFEKGVITLGRNRINHKIFHFYFSNQPPSTLCANYAATNFYQCSEEEKSVESELGSQGLPDDESFISSIEDTGIGVIEVGVDDPNRQLTFRVYLYNTTSTIR